MKDPPLFYFAKSWHRAAKRNISLQIQRSHPTVKGHGHSHIRAGASGTENLEHVSSYMMRLRDTVNLESTVCM